MGSTQDTVVASQAASTLEQPVNLWVSGSTFKRRAAVALDSSVIVDKKVCSLLNKLTMERFEPISDQIIAWVNKSESERDARTLKQVLRLVFERAIDDADWNEMYARLCRKMMDQISPYVQDDGIRSAEGKPITGGLLFRKYLLNRCQEEFERGWSQKESTVATALATETEDQVIKEVGEMAQHSDRYYAVQKAKRQNLGLVKLIGELFKLQMLTEHIMHECIEKLLNNVDSPKEEEIERLCILLTTVGQSLDTRKARRQMDVYFSHMKELAKNSDVSSRMQFMLQGIIELRDRKWAIHNTVSALPTTTQIHKAAGLVAMGSTQDTAATSQAASTLEQPVNLWVSGSTFKRRAAIAPDSSVIVDKKVCSLLNKLTMERFEPISDQIIAWVNMSEGEHDACMLKQVARLVFERAIDDADWNEMYARLCRKMVDQISPYVQDDGVRDAEGKPITGGLIFRKYLLNRCQEDFERGWTQKESTAAAAALATETKDQVIKEVGEMAQHSDRYYAVQKAKRRGLGLIKFIGELFKLRMLTDRTMHECIKELLSNVDSPKEETERLCILLTTVGQSLDTRKARRHMDVYFGRIKQLAGSSKVSSLTQSMLRDLIELREREWTACNVAATGKLPISKEQAERKIAQDCKEFFTVRDLDEAEEYFAALPLEHRHILVEKLVMSGIEAKEADAKVVAELFERALLLNLCSPASFEKGFLPVVYLLDDIAIDAPKAFSLMATMMKGAKLDKELWPRTARKSMNRNNLLALLALSLLVNLCLLICCFFPLFQGHPLYIHPAF